MYGNIALYVTYCYRYGTGCFFLTNTGTEVSVVHHTMISTILDEEAVKKLYTIYPQNNC